MIEQSVFGRGDVRGRQCRLNEPFFDKSKEVTGPRSFCLCPITWSVRKAPPDAGFQLHQLLLWEQLQYKRPTRAVSKQYIKIHYRSGDTLKIVTAYVSAKDRVQD